jgi:diketogulonate reductase-like aldo/keto reductase
MDRANVDLMTMAAYLRPYVAWFVALGDAVAVLDCDVLSFAHATQADGAMKYLDVQGAKLPVVGFGTSGLSGGQCTRMVRTALDIGYRHIDTAPVYGTETPVGTALAATAVPRGEIFLTTKVWRADLRARDLRRSAESSLRALRTDYIDLLLVHWPNDAIPLADTFAGFAALKAEGKIRHAGVANFTLRHLRQLGELRDAAPFANQVEYHARLGSAQAPLLADLRRRGIALIAYSPLGRGLLPRDKVLAAIGAKHGKSASQVALRWLVEQDGVAYITKSASEGHCREGIEVFDFALTAEDRAAIAQNDDGNRVLDPSWAPRWD